MYSPLLPLPIFLFNQRPAHRCEFVEVGSSLSHLLIYPLCSICTLFTIHVSYIISLHLLMNVVGVNISCMNKIIISKNKEF